MKPWVPVSCRLPKEDEFDWVEIRKGEKEYSHPCKVNEYEGSTSFVNILFEKEKGVTHWREKTETK